MATRLAQRFVESGARTVMVAFSPVSDISIWAITAPVSYTHLDVYKRQAKNSIDTHADLPAHAGRETGCLLIEAQDIRWCHLSLIHI